MTDRLRISRSTALCTALVAAVAIVPAASAVKLPGRAKYVGKTSDGSTVQLRLSHDAKRVARLRIHYKLRCDNGRRSETYTVILNAPVRGRRHFRAAGTYTGSADRSTNRFTVTGNLSRRRASGTFKLSNMRRVAGKRVRCSSGRLRWHARRAR